MAEYIMKEQAELIVESALREYIRTGAVETAFEKLYSLPDADVVEVVRCKDCKNLYPDDTGKLHWCDCHRMFVGLDDFCNYGKPKDRGKRE